MSKQIDAKVPLQKSMLQPYHHELMLQSSIKSVVKPSWKECNKRHSLYENFSDDEKVRIAKCSAE